MHMFNFKSVWYLIKNVKCSNDCIMLDPWQVIINSMINYYLTFLTVPRRYKCLVKINITQTQIM